MINFSVIGKGDIFSEQSVYVCLDKDTKGIKAKHLGTGEEVHLSTEYVKDMLKTADQFESEVKVGKEDKYWSQKQIDTAIAKGEVLSAGVREGDVKLQGIRSIWDSITGNQVFTVCFEKQGKTLSDKAYNTKVTEVVDAALAEIETAKVGKKGVAKTAKQILEEFVRNPIQQYIPGDDRVLRGYKLQFKSLTGFYDVMDVDISEQRQVNLNSIKWLVYDGVKYIVE